MLPINPASIGISGSPRLAHGSKILWFLEPKNFFSRTIETYWGFFLAIPSPMRRHVWCAPCFGNIGSAPWSKNVLKAFGGSANSLGPTPRHLLSFLTVGSESWMRLPSMSPDGADRKRDAFKAQVLALTFHNPHLSKLALSF